MGGWMDGWVDGWIDEWMDGWMETKNTFNTKIHVQYKHIQNTRVSQWDLLNCPKKVTESRKMVRI